jgi:hypothetical protein
MERRSGQSIDSLLTSVQLAEIDVAVPNLADSKLSCAVGTRDLPPDQAGSSFRQARVQMLGLVALPAKS